MDNSVDLQLLLDTGSNPPSVTTVAKTIEEQERLKVILSSAYEYAVRKGMQSQMRKINTMISKNERNLDAIYNFSPLMIQGKVVPPVLTEMKDIIQVPNTSTFKSTSVLYQIDKQAYFSTTPPNWRSYLTFPESTFTIQFEEMPTKELAPKGSKQLAEWEKATKRGWVDGEKQANDIFKYSMNKLNRDYIGMTRFHEFVVQGKVSMPSISNSSIALANNGSAMAIDQSMLVIRSLPSFEGNMMKWNNFIAPVEYSPSKQIATINGQ